MRFIASLFFYAIKLRLIIFERSFGRLFRSKITLSLTNRNVEFYEILFLIFFIPAHAFLHQQQ